MRAVTEGRAAYAVVSVENSITGPFAGVAESLCEHPLALLGEVVLPIRHCLLAAPGTRLEDVSVVTSHPSALSQCRDWLAGWGVATRPMSDTAEAARELSESRGAGTGVIGSRTLATTYGLEVLAEGISDRPDNQTRFWILGHQPGGDAEATRTALVVRPVTAPRVLKTLRIQIEARDARRVRVPFLGSEDGTCFVIEFDHRPGTGREIAEEACAGLKTRWLGSWSPSTAA